MQHQSFNSAMVKELIVFPSKGDIYGTARKITEDSVPGLATKGDSSLFLHSDVIMNSNTMLLV